MSIGSWDPSADAAAHTIAIDTATLQRFIELSKTAQLEQLADTFSGSESQELAGLMQLDPGPWLSVADTLAEDDILHLIRFFALAENLPGWEAGQKSPVIPLAKTLRKKGARLDKELLRWLRSVSDNRYLPYGPL
jgi:hypothetical protein